MLSKMKSMLLIVVLSSSQFALPAPSSAEQLQAGIEEADFRIDRDVDRTPSHEPLRIAREPDPAPLNGLVAADDFAPHNFEIGADRNSSEMVLAWERWHHQLTKAIYTRWRAINRIPGRAMMRITVTKDRHITAETLKNKGGPDYAAVILEVIASLENNPGLTFPSKSERQVVTFDCNLTAGHVSAGYTWDKRDFERIRHDK